MIVAFVRNPGRYRRATLLGCIGGILALLLPTVTDFNLQIPANALVFSTILGIGYRAAAPEEAGPGGVPRPLPHARARQSIV